MDGAQKETLSTMFLTDGCGPAGIYEQLTISDGLPIEGCFPSYSHPREMVLDLREEAGFRLCFGTKTKTSWCYMS
jgi:hypothetical protein